MPPKPSCIKEMWGHFLTAHCASLMQTPRWMLLMAKKQSWRPGVVDPDCGYAWCRWSERGSYWHLLGKIWFPLNQGINYHWIQIGVVVTALSLQMWNLGPKNNSKNGFAWSFLMAWRAVDNCLHAFLIFSACCDTSSSQLLLYPETRMDFTVECEDGWSI